MKTKLIISAAAAATLAACSSSGHPQQTGQSVGMANPASVFCVEQGGKLEMKKDKDGGGYALCHLPDGRVVEEWAYFRQNHK